MIVNVDIKPKMVSCSTEFMGISLDITLIESGVDFTLNVLGKPIIATVLSPTFKNLTEHELAEILVNKILPLAIPSTLAVEVGYVIQCHICDDTAKEVNHGNLH